MIGWDALQVPLGLLVAGLLLLSMAWWLLVEYRKAFFTDPVSVMSIEVLASILRMGGPGYLAILTLISGWLMAVGGVFALLFIGGIWAHYVFKAILLTLGFK
jgi:hypothetical protein